MRKMSARCGMRFAKCVSRNAGCRMRREMENEWMFMTMRSVGVAKQQIAGTEIRRNASILMLIMLL